MLAQLQSIVATLCNMGGLLMIIAGTLIVAWALLGSGDMRTIVRGGALVIVGALFSGLGR